MHRSVAIVLLLGSAAMCAQAGEQKRGGSIQGIVENQDGEPLANVKVSVISRRTDERVAQAITDSEGRFAITKLSEGRYALVFFSPEFERSMIRSLEVKSGRTNRIERPIRLNPAKLEAVINGAVFNQDGFLVPGAVVVLERIPLEDEPIDPLKRRTKTNSSGEFAFRLPATAARYRLTASAKGFGPTSETLDIVGVERRHVSIQLDPEP